MKTHFVNLETTLVVEDKALTNRGDEPSIKRAALLQLKERVDRTLAGEDAGIILTVETEGDEMEFGC